LQDPVQLRLRPVEDHALPAEEVARLGDDEPAAWKEPRQLQAVLALREDEDVGKRIAKVTGYARPGAGDAGSKGREAGAGPRDVRHASLHEDREVAGGSVAKKRRQRGFVRKPDGIQAHAERGLHRVVPAGFHVDRLPEALAALEA